MESDEDEGRDEARDGEKTQLEEVGWKQGIASWGRREGRESGRGGWQGDTREGCNEPRRDGLRPGRTGQEDEKEAQRIRDGCVREGDGLSSCIWANASLCGKACFLSVRL